MTCFVYAMREGGEIKIGMSEKPEVRMQSVRAHRGSLIVLLNKWSLADRQQAREVEREAHRLLAKKRVVGEWFDVSEEDADLAVGLAIHHVTSLPWMPPLFPPPRSTYHRRKPVPAMEIIEAAIPAILREFGLTREEFDRDLEEWVESKTDRLTKYAGGYHARLDGLRVDSNPHPLGTYEHTTWRGGWESAEAWELENAE